PRKIDEVLKHSTTSLRSKSIFVYRPRLPTMRVIGSHAISTRRPPVFVLLSRGVVAVVGIGVLVGAIGDRRNVTDAGSASADRSDPAGRRRSNRAQSICRPDARRGAPASSCSGPARGLAARTLRHAC